MLHSTSNLQHINSVTHEGKVIVVASDDVGQLLYTVKQDGFEDSYLNQSPKNRNGWEGWKALEFPDEPTALQVQINKLERQNAVLERKLDAILKKLES